MQLGLTFNFKAPVRENISEGALDAPELRLLFHTQKPAGSNDIDPLFFSDSETKTQTLLRTLLISPDSGCLR